MQQQLLLRQWTYGLRVFLCLVHAAASAQTSRLGFDRFQCGPAHWLCKNGQCGALVERCLVGCPDYLAVQLGDLENLEPNLPTQADLVYLSPCQALKGTWIAQAQAQFFFHALVHKPA